MNNLGLTNREVPSYETCPNMDQSESAILGTGINTDPGPNLRWSRLSTYYPAGLSLLFIFLMKNLKNI